MHMVEMSAQRPDFSPEITTGVLRGLREGMGWGEGGKGERHREKTEYLKQPSNFSGGYRHKRGIWKESNLVWK